MIICRIILYSAAPSDEYHPLASFSLPAAVVQLKYHQDRMFVGLANGTIGIFRRNETLSWDIDSPIDYVILGKDPVVALLPIGAVLYVACGSDVFVLSGSTGEVQVGLFTFLLIAFKLMFSFNSAISV